MHGATLREEQCTNKRRRALHWALLLRHNANDVHEKTYLDGENEGAQTRAVAGIDTLRLSRRGRPGTTLALSVPEQQGLKRFPLPEQGDLVIGRGAESDVPINSASVSRRHARIIGGALPALEDLGSTNGTWVNGTRLTPGQFIVLDEGASVKIGQVVTMVERVEQRASTALDLRPEEVVVRSPKMKEVHDKIRLFARSDCPILVLGETGVGKEVYSSVIVEMSPRANQPFLRINCAALPKDMVESELFGHERGAFTGAAAAKPGLFESAHGGTVLLDEAGDLSLNTQAKLLRALESGEILRLGAVRPRKVDVRILAATNCNLTAMVEEGTFRADLYYRLAGAEIRLPALRERLEDLESLAEFFVQKTCIAMNTATKRLSVGARARLFAHPWPGNVRELKSTIQRAVLVAPGNEIGEEHILFLGAVNRGRATEIPPTMGGTETAVLPLVSVKKQPALALVEPADFYEQRKIREKAAIVAALEAAGGNQTQAAQALQMPRRTLVKRLTEYGIRAPRKPDTTDSDD